MDCRLEDLEHARAHSHAGHALNRLLELDFAADRFRIGWDEITAEEVRGLQVLKEERDRYRQETDEERFRREQAQIARIKQSRG